MRKTKSFPVSLEMLENRCLLSAAVATATTLTAPSATLLGQAFTVSATVQDGTGAAVTSGTVSLLNNGTATDLTAPVNASGQAIFNFGAGNALYAGNYSLTAQYLGTSTDAASTSAAAGVAISLPAFTTTGDGLQIATVSPGSGAGAVTGQNLTMLYTGFYQSSGAEFDESLAHSPGTFTFTLNASPEQVISGFDEGATGIEVGETRVLVIPSDLGYMDGDVRVFVIQSVAADSSQFGSAAALNIGSQPGTASGTLTSSAPVDVDVVDASDNLVQTDSSDVTLAIASGPAGAVLGGTTTVAASSGVASFSDVTFSVPGTYTLTASDSSLAPQTTTPISVTVAPSTVVPSLGRVSLPPAVVAGGKLSAKVPVILTNSGTALKGKVTVNIYANTTTTLDGNQVPVTSATLKNVSIKAGKTHMVNFNIKSLPASLPDGSYYLLAEVVDANNLTNLTATTQTVNVAAAFVQPTISVGGVAPASIAAGKFGSLTITVTNAGNVVASGVDIALTPAAEDGTQIAGVILDSISHSGVKIAPNKSKTFKLRFKSTALTAGSYLPDVSVTLGGVSVSETGTASFTVL
ncbi:MAG TPA: FKBP-type peptidyl-prolyl cis-trans isomerase [Tepidisphaeraceae bacterium]|nr:FKBP-type peptidyl-prolyl cis-trans isomerase [Tepidisphaeraceae bacterium]